jgi:DNA-directed RNA polymerase subunit RPC12/RpoP
MGEKPIRLSAQITAVRNNGQGIACPQCGCRHFTKVRNTMPRPDEIKRYRKCRNCGKTITTYERTASGHKAKE